MPRKDFKRGDKVEVSSKEQGFLGSYYLATVLAPEPENCYLVRYRTLRADDGLAPLEEVVTADDVRPVPPPMIKAAGFAVGDAVDAYGNDGWWLGKVTEVRRTRYVVYFPTSGDVFAYPASKVRPHLEWLHNGEWFAPRFRN